MAHVTPAEGQVLAHARVGRMERMRWPILASILGPIAWLSFTLLYVGFWAQGFTLFQSVILIVVSVLVLGGLMGGIWTMWGFRHADWFEEEARTSSP